MEAWLTPWSLFGATFIVGVFAQMIFPRKRWSVAVVAAFAPLAFLTATVWWEIWEHDALFAVAYLVALLICCGASISSLLTVIAVRWARGK